MVGKPRRCKSCDSEFKPFQSMQRTCSPSCAIADGRAQQKKAYKRETRKMKAKIKTRAQWMKEAQAVFNRYIRIRDKSDPCISCGRYHEGQYHAGHYRSVGSSPELRFDEDNCHSQCAPCNNHLSGNIVNYRPRLIDKIGIDRVELVEGPHDAKKYTIDDLTEIKAKYSEMAIKLDHMHR